MCTIRPCTVELAPLTVDMCKEIAPCWVVLSPLKGSNLCIKQTEAKRLWTVTRSDEEKKIELQLRTAMCNNRPCKVLLAPLTVDMCRGIAPCWVVLSPLKRSNSCIKRTGTKRLWTVIRRSDDENKIYLQAKIIDSRDSENESISEDDLSYQESESSMKADSSYRVSESSMKDDSSYKKTESFFRGDLSYKGYPEDNDSSYNGSMRSTKDESSGRASESSMRDDSSSKGSLESNDPSYNGTMSSPRKSKKLKNYRNEPKDDDLSYNGSMRSSNSGTETASNWSDYSSSSSDSHTFRKSKKITNYLKEPESSMSNYEKMIQRKKEENLTFLQALKINEAKESLVESVKQLNPRKPWTKKIYHPELVAIRKSNRSTKVVMNYNEDDDPTPPKKKGRKASKKKSRKYSSEDDDDFSFDEDTLTESLPNREKSQRSTRLNLNEDFLIERKWLDNLEEDSCFESIRPQ